MWPSSLRQKGGRAPLQFSAQIYCGQTSGWIKMALGMEVGVDPGHIVLDGDPAPFPKKGVQPPIFGPFLLWPNRWMHQDATWYGGRLQPRWLCIRWRPSSPSPKGGRVAPPPIFGPCLLWPNGCMYQDSTWYVSRPLSRWHSVGVDLGPGHILLDGDPAPWQKGHSSPPLFGPCLLWPRSSISTTAELLLKSVNIWQSYRQEGCFTCSVHRDTVLHKDEEFAIDFMYNMNKLFLTVVILVSPLILTLVVTNINLIRPILTSWLTTTITD